MSLCSIPSCHKKVEARGWCVTHYARWWRHGDPLIVIHPISSKSITTSGHVRMQVNGKSVLEHVVIAEQAFGRKLPENAQVHHVDLDRTNNENSNLVICPNDSYHKLLHQRLRALLACGNADARKCWICQQWSTDNLHIRGRRPVHIECIRKKEREQYAARKVRASV